MDVVLPIHVKMVVHAKHYQVEIIIVFVHKIIMENIVKTVSKSLFSFLFDFI
jgi:hypothetical protein